MSLELNAVKHRLAVQQFWIGSESSFYTCYLGRLMRNVVISL
jgi:hypothetical protein